MLTMLKIIHFNPALVASEHDRVMALLTEVGKLLPGVRGTAIGKTLPRALNGGQLMWRVVFASETDYWTAVSSSQWQKQIVPALAAERGIYMDSLAYKTPFSDTSSGRFSR